MLIALLLAQVTPVQPMPKGTALPPPATDEAAVLAPVEAMFAALAAKDPAAIPAQVRADGRATAVVTAADGSTAVRASSWAEFAQRVGGISGRPEERLNGRPAVEIDGDIAMVWAPYTFRLDGKISHCGTNHVDLVREGGRWRVVNITWSQRRTGCDAQ